MRTLVTDDEPERPEYIGPNVTISQGTLTSNMVISITTTGGFIMGDPPPPEVYRTQAYVDKPKEISNEGAGLFAPHVAGTPYRVDAAIESEKPNKELEA